MLDTPYVYKDYINRESNFFPNVEDVVNQNSDRLLRHAIHIEEGSQSSMAFLICSNSHNPLSQLIYEGSRTIMYIKAILDEKFKYEQILRLISILSSIFVENLTLSNSELFEGIIHLFQFIKYPDCLILFRNLLTKSPNCKDIQKYLFERNFFIKILEFFNELKQKIDYNSHSFMLSLQNTLEMLRKCSRIEIFQTIIFDPSYLSNFIVDIDDAPKEVKNVFWLTYHTLQNDKTAELFENQIINAVNNINNLGRDGCPVYVITSIMFLYFFIGRNNEVILDIGLIRSIPILLDGYPDHFYLINVIEDFYYACLKQEDLILSALEILPFFASKVHCDHVTLRAFSTRIMVHVRTMATKNKDIYDVVIQLIDARDSIWDDIAEREQLASGLSEYFEGQYP